MKRRHRYRLLMVNDSTFNEIFSLRLSRGRVAVALGCAFVIFVVLGALVVSLTPVRVLLPGYIKADERISYIEADRRVDSLSQALAANEAYTANLRRILSDDIDISESDAATTTSVTDTLSDASEAERDFVARYERDMQYNVSVLSDAAAKAIVWSSPASGSAVTSKPGDLRMTFAPTAAMPVTAIGRGSVLDVTFGPKTGYTVTIQHQGGFVSRYASLSESYVTPGSKIAPSQRIGRADGDLYGDVAVEMWHDGAQLAPDTYLPK